MVKGGGVVRGRAPTTIRRGRAYWHSKLADAYVASDIERQYGGAGPARLERAPWWDTDRAAEAETWATRSWSCGAGVMRTLALRAERAGQGPSTSVWAAVTRELEGKKGRQVPRKM